MSASSSAAATPGDGHPSLPDVLYLSLRERILSGALAPGSELRQEVLARQFGMSRVPVREALSRLQAEGLIVLRPRRGFAVTSLDIADIIEIFELRMVLEQHAVDTATRLRTAADVAAVEALLRRMETLPPETPGYMSVWLDINRAFHARIIASARRPRLANITSTLRDTIEPYVRIESHLTGGFDDARGEHRALFTAFRDRAGNRAGEISRDHCLGTMNRLLDSIRARQATTPLVFGRKPRGAVGGGRRR
jgi:DNA-binding GntR family transcriptional regulator